jgi:hypothetical protein
MHGWELLRSAWLLHIGWVTGWQRGYMRNVLRMLPEASPKATSPLLRLHVSTLRLNPSAGQSRPEKWMRRPLQLAKQS